MASKFQVTMDTEKEKAFLVHLPDRIVKFKQMTNGLYGMNPKNKNEYVIYKNKPFQFVGTIKENMKYLSPRQQERAKKARELLHALGNPTEKTA